jgi:hypothetical protein
LDLGHDVTDAEDGRRAQNIIHQYPCCLESGEMCSLWKRIDYGYRSIIINPDRLFAFLHDRRNELIEVLQNDRYQMLQLAVAYLFNRDAVSSYDVGRLEQLICVYRRSSLQHYAYGFGPAGGDVCIMEDTQSLL